jgi:hypothetical protein
MGILIAWHLKKSYGVVEGAGQFTWFNNTFADDEF